MAPETNGTSGGTGLDSYYYAKRVAAEAVVTTFRETMDELLAALEDVANVLSEIGQAIGDAMAAACEEVLPRPSGGRIQPWKQPPRRPVVHPVMAVDAVRAGRRMLYPRARRI